MDPQESAQSDKNEPKQQELSAQLPPSQYGYANANQQSQQPPPYGYSYQKQPPPAYQGAYNPQMQYSQYGQQYGPPPMMTSPSGMKMPQPMVAPSMMTMSPVGGLYPGQGGMNPCSCCRCCCGGTCTLKTGCIVIACYLLLNALAAIGFGAREKSEISNTYNAYERDIARVLNYVREADWHLPLFLADGLLINLGSSVILLAGCLCLNQLCCYGFAIFQGLSCLWALVFAWLLSARASSYDGLIEDPNSDAKSFVASMFWASAVFALALKVYFICCGIGLAQQISRGEYGLVGGGGYPAIMPVVQSPIMYYPDDAGAP